MNCSVLRICLAGIFMSGMILFRVLPCSAEENAPPPAPAAKPAALGTSHYPFEKLPNGDLRLGSIMVHPATREISFPGIICLSSGILEVVIATPTGRLHETLVSSDISPLQLQAMLYLLGYGNGPRMPDSTGRQGDLLDIELAWTDAAGVSHREPVEKWIKDMRIGTASKPLGWAFVGSTVQDGEFLAEVEGNIAVNYSVASTILDIPDPDSLDDTIFVVNEEMTGPGKDASVTVILKPHSAK